MKKIINFNLLQICVALILPSISFSVTITEDIAQLCQDNPIILLGETHHQPDSPKLLIDIVQHYIARGDKVFAGLEIPSDKQAELEQALTGGNDFSFINPTINHLAYQKMVHTLGGLKVDVIVKAIDAQDGEISRDTVMSRNIMLALASKKYTKTIVLVGNNHTIKNIKWHEDVFSKEQYLAGKLIGAGGNPCSIHQVFTKPNGKPVLIEIDTSSSASMAIGAIQHINHSNEMTGDLVCDAIIEWK
jgi:hypothetical protein